MNGTKMKNPSSSMYRGVHWGAHADKWVTQIRISGKNTHVGCFENEEDAAIAYDSAAREHHGDFAGVNFP